MDQLLSFLALVLVFSCTTSKDINTYWVSGSKADCTGVAPMKCLKVYRGEDVANANWEYFYSDIEGFDFEEGFLQKIKVEEEQLKPENVPADASSIRYRLVEVVEKRQDTNALLEGKWMATKINGEPIEQMDQLPSMNFDLDNMRVSGSTSCNNYTADIMSLSGNSIKLVPGAMTEKMCLNNTIEQTFNQAFNGIATFNIEGDQLTFFDEQNTPVLSFRRPASKEAMQALHDIWTTVRINNRPINRMVKAPNLEINLSQMRIMGNDGCNSYSAVIQQVTDELIEIGPVAATKKACKEKNMAAEYYTALDQVASYRREGLKLLFFDEKGEEVLAFLKVD